MPTTPRSMSAARVYPQVPGRFFHRTPWCPSEPAAEPRTGHDPAPPDLGLPAQPAGAHVKATAEEGLPCQWLHPPPLRAVVVVAPARYPRGRFDEWSESFRSVVSFSEPLPKRCAFLRCALRRRASRRTGRPARPVTRPAGPLHKPICRTSEPIPPTHRVGSGVPNGTFWQG